MQIDGCYCQVVTIHLPEPWECLQHQIMIQYISYSDLNEFYSIKEVCRLLEMDKENLRKSCEKYNVKPSRNEIGDWGLTCHDLRRLHNFLYKAEKNLVERKDDDPWA